MSTVREGNQPVLVVVDVQVGVVGEVWDAARVIANVARAVERARAQDVPVLWVQHVSDELPSGSPPWQWVPELMPAPGEPLIAKRFESSFEETALEAELARLGASHIVLAGAQSSWCIRATAYAALDRGYDLTLVKDAHTTGDMDFGDGTVIAGANIVRELNAAMTWISYPGRKNGTATVEQLDFATPGGVR